LLTLVYGFPNWPGGDRPGSTQAQVYTMLSPNHNHRTPGKITLDLSTALGEYSKVSSIVGLSYYPSPATADLTPHSNSLKLPQVIIERVDEPHRV
jgi:hypothetical protein